MDAPAAKSKLIKGATGDWEVVIGMEVHAQVASQAKLFSGASTEFGGEPNAHVSFVDAAMPGMLPVINERCVEQAVRTGLGLNAKINLRSVFDRKNYFFPDLPAGYQISQYKDPIVGEGVVEIDLADGQVRKVGIERVSPWSGSNSRVSWLIVPPSSITPICRQASCSIAWPMKRMELRFLISQRVPNGAPGLCTETFTSARRWPFSMSPSQVPR